MASTLGRPPGPPARLVGSPGRGTRGTARRPGGPTWLDGEITATREWRRAVREHRTLLITGPDLGPAARGGGCCRNWASGAPTKPRAVP
ncbi:hypothetical protein ACWC5I_37205 [Kitasatospora sp. NPDC001574]